MTPEYQIVFASLGLIFGVARYGLYFRDIFRGKTKPHVFSWFVWGFTGAIVFVAQLKDGAGAGAWVTGLVAAACLTISVLAIWWGEKKITRIDWFCFFAALAGVALWLITKAPLSAVVIVSVSDALAYVPTYRKAFYKPQEEGATSYVFATMRSVFGILALQSFTLVNWLYPASLVLTDGAFTLMLLVRRKQLATMPRNGR